MPVPFELQKKVVSFLETLPGMSDGDGRRALIHRAGADPELQNLINFDKPPAHFFSLLVSILIKYGKLSDGRDALESVLQAAKESVGQDKRDYCDTLIREIWLQPEDTYDSGETILSEDMDEADETEKWMLENDRALTNAYSNDPKGGIAPRDIVFSRESDLPGQVFNIELLTNPIVIKKRRGRTCVVIDRDNVRWGLYSLAGREKINALTFPDSPSKEEAIQYDMDIHRFLIEGQKDESFQIIHPNLRWASGGVLSIVEFKNRQWVPFFFRDMPPYGWQICQGASEKKEDDLNDPWSFIMREFLEEMLVYHNAEHSSNIVHHPFCFSNYISVDQQTERAKKLSRKHNKLRFQRDGMQFEQGEPIVAEIVPTTMRLQIRQNNMIQTQEMPGFLVLFNITELGVEVIKVVRYELGDNDYILSGEIYDPYGSHQAELIREPVALISLDYLRKAFENKIEYKFSYKFDKDLPSVMALNIPPDDIHIFLPDAVRRCKIALGVRMKPSPTLWEKDLYIGWHKTFGKYFFDANNDVTVENACSLFTPTAAKVMTYYFAYC